MDGNAERRRAVVRFISLTDTAHAGVWNMNFVSGYSSTLLACTPIATTAGYKRNAEIVPHGYRIFIRERVQKEQGKNLLRAIIDSNF